MSDIDFATAELFAADLRGKSVDHNEVKKLLSYMRSQTNGRALFEYLQIIIKYPKVVDRSNQTVGHFQSMLEVSERHLRPLQHDYRQLMATLGWGIRLMRYYKEVPSAAPRRSFEKPVATATPVVAPAPAAPAKPTDQSLREVGATFTGKILDIDDESGDVAVEVPGSTTDKAIGRIKAENLGGKKFKVGNSARVEVMDTRTLKSGRVVLELRPAQKPGG
ncbi:MAG: hypothetical protein WCK70_00415 [Chloroflexales bacterium]